MANETTNTPVIRGISEEKALELLKGLIEKPDTKADEIPKIWAELIEKYNSFFVTPEPEVKKKKRRRRNPDAQISPDLGWPQGIGRAEYKAWKESLPEGYQGKVNPREYARIKAEPKPEVEATVPKATNKKKADKTTDKVIKAS